MRWLIFSIGLMGYFHIAEAQSGTETFPRGARSMGMANANVTWNDAWSFFNNIGGLSRLEQSQIVFGYDHRLDLEELTTLSAAAVFQKNNAAFGVGVSSFGSDFFSQNQLGIGVSNHLGIASLGIKINYFQTSIEGFGTGRAAVLEVGGVAELSPELFFGAHIYNPTRARYGRFSQDHLPTVVKAGLSYRPSEKVSFQIEAEKDILLDPLLKMGLEYNFFNKVWGRTGVASTTRSLFFGIGFHGKSLQIDYAMTQHPTLGNTHHFSTNIRLRK
ncbi:hypothetical protein [Cecembia calidifontis]|uniref:Type IX secretion system PorP/SprF family membrane protein n=1 Tax=Cecembia calidifontis TaxID=1187080 RepID=A0A4Q7PA29_9BACT|nr:hypothetical protein [Cecembia calidifontis]RZS97015.1 hypothetical protein BC751_2612 [Cecembia calidifontis]